MNVYKGQSQPMILHNGMKRLITTIHHPITQKRLSYLLFAPPGLGHNQRTKPSRLCVNVVLMTSLMDTYSKCGLLSNSIQVFEEMPDKDPTLTSAMLSCYFRHKMASEACLLFKQITNRDTDSWIAVISGPRVTWPY
ncbi:hypothetical protein AMTR_s00007p00204580 [Amborella trichopoda]|uniref:Pentatricopeptide repeat-containing protein n=1 Tax=Amborella trichopoda TaxID=13333 RepID=W1PCL7_AMBTC|nr:hypothetical protein AMTR_s00007p00204580 [Amborella trichopoda]